MFANYLYSCFVPFRHSQRLVEWVACYKVQAEVTSAGRHIIYVISVLNYLHRKYGRLTSASTATVGDVLRAVASSGSGHAVLSVSPIVPPDSYDVFFLILFFHRFGFRFFSAYSSFSDFFVIVAALGSVAANDMLKWPKRFILPILCRLLASVLLCFYIIIFVCLVQFCFTFRCGWHCNFLISRFLPAFGICFACFPVLLLVIELSACMHPLP